MNTNRLAIALTIINLILLIVVITQSRMIANQTIPEVLRVRAFEVVFRLRDEKETIRVKLGASEEGSGLLLINDLTEPGVHLLAKQDDTSVTLTDQSGAEQVIKP